MRGKQRHTQHLDICVESDKLLNVIKDREGKLQLAGKRNVTKHQAIRSDTQDMPCVHTEHIQTLPYQTQASEKWGK